MRYVLLTGMSGAGKSVAIRYLEDTGAFCIDNVPAMLMPKIVEACEGGVIQRKCVAFAVDVRSGEFFDGKAVADLIAEMRRLGHRIDTVFMDAGDDVLVTRYKETRRDHPLARNGISLTEAIMTERNRLQPLREIANYVLDTSNLKPKDLQKLLRQTLEGGEEELPPIRVEVMSFGFKRGLPRQADLVLDVRFLPNPFYIESLCRHSGQDEDVRSFVMNNETTQAFMTKIKDLLAFLLPGYRDEGKHRLVIAVGCTGGAHRSVAIAEAIGGYLREIGYVTDISHRDLLIEQARWSVPAGEDE